MRKFFNYIFVIFLILTFNSVYSVIDGKNLHFKEIMTITAIIFLIVNFPKKNEKNYINTKRFIFMIYMYISYVLLYIVFTSYKGEFCYLYLLLFLVFLITLTSKPNLTKEVLKMFLNVMIVIAIISLFFYIFGSVLNIIKTNSSIIINWGGKRSISSYFGLHFNIQKVEMLGKKIYRNTSIFTEAPMYSFLLTVALCIELFFEKTKSKRKTSLLFLTTLSTMSTAGIIFSIALIIVNYIVKSRNSKNIKSLRFLIIPMILLVGCFAIYKTYNSKTDSSSYNTRIDDFEASFKAFKEKPILGNGFKNDEAIIKYMGDFRSGNTGLSNSLMVLLAHVGIYMSLIYWLAFILAIKKSVRKKEKNVTILAILLGALFITTIYMYKPLAIFFISASYAYYFKNESTGEKD